MKQAALKGDTRTMAAVTKGRRKLDQVLDRVTTAEGDTASGGAQVTAAMDAHFAAAFGRGIVRQGPLADLGEESERGRSLRERAAKGNLPSDWQAILGEETF